MIACGRAIWGLLGSRWPRFQAGKGTWFGIREKARKGGRDT